MVKISATYEGDLHCKATHGPSKDTLLTDAPVDNNGKGEHFSPTDLVVTAMATCTLTIMGIYAKKHSIHMEGAKVEAVKEMSEVPYRHIKKITLDFTMPSSIADTQRQALEKAAQGCPVTRSLGPNTEVILKFQYL